jgi:hypothetical protein
MNSVPAVKEEFGAAVENGAAVEKPFNLGVLFVHGIGTQTPGQTLTAFGGPFCQWLKDRCEAIKQSRVQSGVAEQRKLQTFDWTGAFAPSTPPGNVSAEAISHRVVLSETKFHDPTDFTAPAHTKVAVLSLHCDNQVSEENWLLAESCWADTFSPPSFAHLAHWSFAVLPWIVGSHFAAQIRRRVRERPTSHSPSDPQATRAPVHHRIWAMTGWIWRLAAAIGGYVFGLLLSAIMLPILAILLVVGLIPISRLRSALLNLQLRMAATLGDCYVLLARPIEAASIVSEVRRDLLWLSSRCSEVVIVAHSQGGAVAHLALRGQIPEEFRLLFTFGSGRRKLEEARQLMKRPESFTRSGVITSIALWILLLCSTALWAAIRAVPKNGQGIAVLLGYDIVAAAVCTAGIRDHLRGIRLHRLHRWIKHLKTTQLRWIDCYATADPVPNGVVTKARFVAHLSREVCNRSSMLIDHTTYWSNLDEFVSLLYDEIAKSRRYDPLPNLRIEESHLQQITKRRRWRVAIGHFIQWVGIAGVLIVFIRRSHESQALAQWAWSSAGGWLLDKLKVQHANAPVLSVDWTMLALLTGFLVPFGIVRRLWANWDQAEMKRVRGLKVDSWVSETVMLTGLWFLVLIATETAKYELSLSPWVLAISFAPSLIFMVLKPGLFVSSAREKRVEGGAIATESEETSVGRLVLTIVGVATAAFFPFSLGLAAWSVLVWLTAHLSNGELAGFRPDSISSEVVGLVAVGVTAIVSLIYAVIYAMRHRNPSVSPSSQT